MRVEDDNPQNPRFYAKGGKIYFKHQLDAKFIVEREARESDAEEWPDLWRAFKPGGGTKKCLS